MYEIIDTHTGKAVGTAKTLKAASRICDHRDNAYGAYRYLYRNALKGRDATYKAQAAGVDWQKQVVEGK